ncbi:GDA1/CD39 (nucleoside phosphatase) family domain-containing protein [Phthorimaea operculella]|nr:GDA1/CD39 (nucleoside phosphatase) family domain-containing protein [Phthorimaea operculella]
MGKFSTYRYLELKDDSDKPAVPHISSRSRIPKQPRRLKKVFILLIVLALCVTYLLGFLTGGNQWFDGLAKSLGYESVYHHAVIIDAGSSGSRVLSYKFRVPFTVRHTYLLQPPRGLHMPQCSTHTPALEGNQWFDGLAKSLGYESVYHHAVIIDAGSSGSRVLSYKFRVPFTVFGPASLDLVEEYFEQSKPGLSAYADDPAKGAQTIVDLIKNAEHLTPVEKRRDTPILVRATAGLRLLPKDKAQSLIDHVALAISKLGYNTGSNSVQIMDGADEGIFIWYTVNLLHNLIETETMAALDLGGGSTQITFQLSETDTSRYPTDDQYVVPAGNNITLYTHSYLNLGLYAARYGLFKQEAGNASATEFNSVCVDPIVQNEPWVYANKDLKVSGVPRKQLKKNDVYNRCHEVVKKYVMSTLDWEPSAPPKGRVAAMSFFFDVAADAGLIATSVGRELNKYVMSTLDWEPSAPPKGRVAAMSFFFDVAADAGLIATSVGRELNKYVMSTLDWEPSAPPKGRVAAMSFFFESPLMPDL